jgi:PA14 domain/K319L-like, PKD domain
LRTVIALVIATCVSAASAEASVRLAWEANTEPDIAGYRLSYGTTSGQYATTIDVGNVTTFDFFEPNTSVKYFLAVRAYNAAGLSGPYSNEISTTPVPQPLRVTSIWSSHTSPQVTGTSITFTAITTGGTAPLQFKWWIVNGATTQVAQNWSTNASFVWAPSTAGSYAVRAWARNAGNTADAPASSEAVMEMPIVINAPANAAPTVNAGPDRTITLPSSASLQGSASDDGKPSPPAAMTFSWTRVSGPGTVTFSAPTATVTNATFSAAGTYVLQLSASDSALSTSDTVAVTVNAAATNAAPTVNAGNDLTVMLPSTASLQGSASDDGRPSPPAAITLSWTRVSGPGTVTFSAPVAAVTNATFSAAGTYVLQLSASDSALSTTDTVTVTVNPAAGGGGGGLIGRYYNNPAAGVYDSTLALTRTDSTVNFNWGTGSPGPGVQAENFNIEWTGTVLAPVSGQYRFSTTSDDGIRVWVNGRLMINNWTDHAPTTNTSRTINLTAGVRYSIRVQYYERGGGATIVLRWTPPGQASSVIPAANLVP